MIGMFFEETDDTDERTTKRKKSCKKNSTFLLSYIFRGKIASAL
jgi:hypothetical protein